MASPDATNAPFSSGKSLRGLNKPKCIKCGNVARSRCPFQSCKNCCAKAQNPCHIHVLKGSSSLPEKPPASSSPQVDQPPAEVPFSVNVNRLRQLSNNFSQFNNLQGPLRPRKPLTKKDAQLINEWRFLKLKEFRDGKIQAENEAFDRYMQNVGLLEEVFSAETSPQGERQLSSPTESLSDGEGDEPTIQQLKSKLRSEPSRQENFRKRVKFIVDQGLNKLRKNEPARASADIITDEEEAPPSAKKMKFPRGERSAAALVDLHDKLSKVRNEDDLEACYGTAASVFGWDEKPSQIGPPFAKEHIVKWVHPLAIDSETMRRVNDYFSSLGEDALEQL